MSTQFDLVQYDTASALKLKLVDQDGVAIDITNANIKLRWYINAYPPIEERTMAIVGDPKNGVVQYQFTGSNGVFDLSKHGNMHYQVRIIFANTTVLTTPFLGFITVHPAI